MWYVVICSIIMLYGSRRLCKPFAVHELVLMALIQMISQPPLGRGKRINIKIEYKPLYP